MNANRKFMVSTESIFRSPKRKKKLVVKLCIKCRIYVQKLLSQTTNEKPAFDPECIAHDKQTNWMTERTYAETTINTFNRITTNRKCVATVNNQWKCKYLSDTLISSSCILFICLHRLLFDDSHDSTAFSGSNKVFVNDNRLNYPRTDILSRFCIQIFPFKRNIYISNDWQLKWTLKMQNSSPNQMAFSRTSILSFECTSKIAAAEESITARRQNRNSQISIKYKVHAFQTNLMQWHF